MNGRLLMSVLLLFLCACASPGGAYRTGPTIIPPTTSTSLEQYHLTGMGSGDGWHLLWVGGDEFVYCIDDAHPEWIAAYDTAVKTKATLVVFYQDGGGGSTGACHPGPSDVFKVRVIHMELLTEETDLRHEHRVSDIEPSGAGTP